MKVFLDGKLYKQSNSLKELKNILDGIKEQISEGEILQIKVNDRFVDSIEDDWQTEDIETVEAYVKKPEELVLEGIGDGIRYIPELVEYLGKTSRYFQVGRVGEGIDLFIKELEGLEWLNHILSGLNFYYVAPGKIEIEGFEDNLNDFQSVLRELMEAWKNQDYVLISDLIEYELINNLEIWEEEFIKLQEISGE